MTTLPTMPHGLGLGLRRLREIFQPIQESASRRAGESYAGGQGAFIAIRFRAEPSERPTMHRGVPRGLPESRS
jgi:hypothetical protein